MELIFRDYIPFITTLSLYTVIGMTGNVLLLIVYWRERIKLGHTVFIKILSIMDLTVCSLIIPYTILFELHLIKYDFVCRFFELVRHFFVLYSNFILIAIAIERYFAVCKPMKKLTYEQLRITVIVGLVISVTLALPVPTIFRVCKLSECLIETMTGNDTYSTGSDVTSTIGIEPTIQLVDEEAYCQFTTTILGRSGSDVYQALLCLVFLVAVIIFSAVYPMVYRVIIRRSRWRLNRVGVFRMSDLEMINSNNINVKTVDITTTDPTTSRAGNTTQGPYTMPLSAAYGSSLQVTSMYSSSLRKDLPKPERMRNSKTGTMLFVCTAIFVIVWVPFWIDIFTAVENLTFRYLFLLGHVTNPIVYGVVSKEVRSEIWNLFPRLK